MFRPEITLLLEILDRSFNRRSWHGPNLRGSIRGLDVATASFRPGSDRHNIWEHVVHAAYWKYTVRRRLLGEKRGSFPLEGSNWIQRPVNATNASWQADIKLLEEMHKTLRAAIAELDPKLLHHKPAGSTVSNFDLITGIAAHDVYHAGQIQLIKRLASRS